MGKAQLKVDLRMISLPKKFILSSDNAKLCLIERIFPVTYLKKKKTKERVRESLERYLLVSDGVDCSKFFFPLDMFCGI